MMPVECAACLSPILDRFLLHFMEKSWHSSCVKCQICQKLLEEKCYFKEGSIYCKEDFFRYFGPKCYRCQESILPNDYVRKAKEKLYHMRCFVCSACSKQLTTGEILYVGSSEDSFWCKEDYFRIKQDTSNLSEDEEDFEEKIIETNLTEKNFQKTSKSYVSQTLNLNFNSNEKKNIRDPNVEANNNLNPEDKCNNLELDNESLDGDASRDDIDNKGNENSDGSGGKRRGPRTTIKAKQLEVLKNAFNQTPKPTRHIREQLAKETGLSMRVIQVWFQNKRSKERRMKQMSNGIIAGRGFFHGKSNRRGFPLIGDEFSFYTNDPKYSEFGFAGFSPPESFFQNYISPDNPIPIGTNGTMPILATAQIQNNQPTNLSAEINMNNVSNGDFDCNSREPGLKDIHQTIASHDTTYNVPGSHTTSNGQDTEAESMW